MSTIPALPALQVRPPQPQESPLDIYSKIISLRSLLQGQQIQQEQLIGEQQKNQMGALQLKDAQAMTAAMDEMRQRLNTPSTAASTPSDALIADGTAPPLYRSQPPSATPSKLNFSELPDLIAKHGGSYQAVMKAKSDILDYTNKLREGTKTDLANQGVMLDGLAGLVHNVASLPPEQQPQAFEDAKQEAINRGWIDAQGAAAIQYPGPQKLGYLEASFLGSKELLENEQKKAATARDIAQTAEFAPLGDKAGQLNEAMQSRWQVLHPGQPLPSAFALSPTSTAKDFERIDKVLQQSESAANTVAQRQQIQAMREQTYQLAKQAQLDRQQKQNLDPVMGTDATGKTVLVPLSQATELGLKDVMKAESADVSKALSARHLIPLLNNPDPGDAGVMQLVDKLDKNGKLGVIASRWNDFLSGKLGAGDPDYTRLRTRLGLSNTLLMNAHVGSRGGSYMLEHFEDLANAKKLNAENLRAGIDEEYKYVQSRAMLPAQGGQAPQADGSEPTATGPGGHKISFRNGLWVDSQTGAPIQ